MLGKGIQLPSLLALYREFKTLQHHLILETLSQKRLTAGRGLRTLGSHTPNQHPPQNILAKPMELATKGNEAAPLSFCSAE